MSDNHVTKTNLLLVDLSRLVWLIPTLSVIMLGCDTLLYVFAIEALGLPSDAHPLQSYASIVLTGILLFVLNMAFSMWFIRKRDLRSPR